MTSQPRRPSLGTLKARHRELRHGSGVSFRFSRRPRRRDAKGPNDHAVPGRLESLELMEDEFAGSGKRAALAGGERGGGSGVLRSTCASRLGRNGRDSTITANCTGRAAGRVGGGSVEERCRFVGGDRRRKSTLLKHSSGLARRNGGRKIFGKNTVQIGLGLATEPVGTAGPPGWIAFRIDAYTQALYPLLDET